MLINTLCFPEESVSTGFPSGLCCISVFKICDLQNSATNALCSWFPNHSENQRTFFVYIHWVIKTSFEEKTHRWSGKASHQAIIRDAGAMQSSYFPLSFAGNNEKHLVTSVKSCEPGPQFKRVTHCNRMDYSTMHLGLKFKVFCLGFVTTNEVGFSKMSFSTVYLKLFSSGDQQHSHNSTDEKT